MLTKDLGPLVLSLAVAGPASAEVKSATPTGFEIVTMATISAPADRVYAALGEVGRWWSPSHTFSRDAGNLSLPRCMSRLLAPSVTASAHTAVP